MIRAALIQFANTFERFGEAEAKRAYNALWRIFWSALIVCAIGYTANLWGYKTPSALLLIGYVIYAAYTLARPFSVAVVAFAGAVSDVVTRSPLGEDVKWGLKLYVKFGAWLLLVPSAFLLLTAMVFVEANTDYLLKGIGGIIVFTLMSSMWPKVFPGNMGKKSVYYFAVVVIVLACGSLVSNTLGALVVKHTGWDPVAVVPTSTEESLYRLARTQRETAEADRAKDIDRVTTKVKRREALTDADKRVIAEAQRSKSTAKESSHVPGTEIRLPIPPGGRSSFTVGPGEHADVTGSNFRVYNVYQDGHECESGDACVDGPLASAYVLNTDKKNWNTVFLVLKK